jgi:membrane protein
MSLGFYWGVLKETYQRWTEDKVPRLGAALAYYSVFSLAPLLLIAISIAGLVFKQQAEAEILHEIKDTLGADAAGGLEAMVQALRQSSGATLATIFGVVVLFFGATGVFIELQDALNTIWKVAPRPSLGWRELIGARLLSVSVVLGTGGRAAAPPPSSTVKV